MRIRQVVFVARELAPASQALATLLALAPPFADPGVAEFGLDNAVYVFGDQFIEIVSPTRADTTAGRLLDKRGDGGYMLILQSDDFERERVRLDALGVRRVWARNLPDIRAMHLHPKDIGGAIVSIDQPVPPDAWRWGGPDWRLQPGRAAEQRVRGVTLAAADPAATAQRWAEVLGLPGPVRNGAVQRLALDGGWVDFEPAAARGEGIVGYTLAVAGRAAVRDRARELGLPATDDGFDFLGTRIALHAL
jgi:hypothetical protein